MVHSQINGEKKPLVYKDQKPQTEDWGRREGRPLKVVTYHENGRRTVLYPDRGILTDGKDIYRSVTVTDAMVVYNAAKPGSYERRFAANTANEVRAQLNQPKQ